MPQRVGRVFVFQWSEPESPGKLARAVRRIALLTVLMSLHCGPIRADSSHPRWATDPRAICKLFDPDPLPKETVTWSGGCKSGYATGFGVANWYDDGKFVEREKGNFQRGVLAHGIGSVDFANGDKYSGEFQDGEMDGRGTYLFANGDKYVGDFKANKRSGQALMTFANGDSYVGSFRDDKMNGLGTYTYANGTKLIARFRDGVPIKVRKVVSGNRIRYLGRFRFRQTAGWARSSNLIGFGNGRPVVQTR